MNNNSNGNKGIGFCGLLAIVFIVLKLVGVISWSWLWVLSPIWISAGLALIFFIIGLILYRIADWGGMIWHDTVAPLFAERSQIVLLSV